MKDVLCSGQDLDDQVWKKVVSEADNDGDGEIDFEEFCNMMQKMLNYDEDEDDMENEDVAMIDNGGDASQPKLQTIRE